MRGWKICIVLLLSILLTGCGGVSEEKQDEIIDALKTGGVIGDWEYQYTIYQGKTLIADSGAVIQIYKDGDILNGVKISSNHELGTDYAYTVSIMWGCTVSEEEILDYDSSDIYHISETKKGYSISGGKN